MELSAIELATFTERTQQTQDLTPDQLAKLSPYDLLMTCLAWRSAHVRGADMRRYHARRAEDERAHRNGEAFKNQQRINQISDMLSASDERRAAAEQSAARADRLIARLKESLASWEQVLTLAEREYQEALAEALPGRVRTHRYDIASQRRQLAQVVNKTLCDLLAEADRLPPPAGIPELPDIPGHE